MKKLIVMVILTTLSLSVNARQISKSPIPYGLSEVECLALNIYFEARAEKSNYNLAAVGFVTKRRMATKHWPNTICKVVYQQRLSNKTKKWVPMYSWTLDGKSDRPRNFKIYNRCLQIATWVLNGTISDKTRKATHYHNTSVNPYWAASMIKTANLGNHIFYK